MINGIYHFLCNTTLAKIIDVFLNTSLVDICLFYGGIKYQ